MRLAGHNVACRLGFWCLWATLVACGRAGTSAPSPYPHEYVLTVFAELKLYLDQDPYKLAPGRDLQGRNIFRVTLERLDALSQAASPAYADVDRYARGLCLERLGDWAGATAAFDRAAGAATSLSGPARDRAQAARRMAALVDRDRLDRSTLEACVNDLEVMDRRLMDWAAEPKALWPYAAYARDQAERERAERAALLFDHRRQLADGAARAIKVAASMTTDFADSYRAGEHWILLGSFHESLARDWAAQRPPTGTGVADAYGERGPWRAWVEQSRAAYRKAAQSDGDAAKPEAEARLRALDAFALRVASLGR